MTLLLACAACALAGTFGSMVGLGGGIIIIPVLSQVLGYDLRATIAASLIGVIAGSIAASPRFLAAGIVDRRIAVTLLLATAAGGLTGGLTASYLDERSLGFLFATLLVVVAVHMLREFRRPAGGVPGPGAVVATPGPDPTDVAGPVRAPSSFDAHYLEPRTGELTSYSVRRLGPAFGASFVAGNVSGLLGVGGGIINVPTIHTLMGVPLRVATTTSTLMIGATATSSALVNITGGHMDPLLAAPVVVGVLIGSRVGAHASLAIPAGVLRLMFVAVALVFAAQMYLRLG